MTVVPGLCSVTYRALPADRVAALAADSGLAAIEWGADVHAPPDSPITLDRVRELTLARGLAVAAYGSYFRAGPHGEREFLPVARAAARLGAPRVRIWSGDTGSAQTDPDRRREVVAATRAAAMVAADHGLRLGFEFHGGTLTDTVDSTLRLLEEVDRPVVATYWQPPVGAADDEAVAGLRRLLPRVCAVHVFSWWPETERLPLAARGELWRRALAELAMLPRRVDALLEFVPDDDPAALPTEAATLTERVESALP